MGGGKSYHGAELVYEALKEGAIVHTNLPLVWEIVELNGWADRVVELKGEPGSWVRRVQGPDGRKTWASDILVMGKEGAENLVVVDEAAIEISADDQQDDKKKNQALFGLVALCRHAGLDMYFLAQVRSHVAKKVRDLAETRTMCTNCANIPVIGWYLKRFHGDLRRSVYKDGEFYGSCYLRLKPEICEFYRTHGMRDQLEMKSGGHRVKKASAWTQRGVWTYGGAFIASISLLVWSLWGTWGIFNKPEPIKKDKPVAATETKKVDRIAADGSKKQLDVPVKPPAPKGGILLEWDPYDEHTLAGVIQNNGRKTVITRGGRRLYAGGAYEGIRIELQFQVADWHYFQCENKRLIVVRPLRPEEREALPPVTIHDPSALSVDRPAASVAGSIIATLKNPLQ